jgi:hypothetical protein
MVLHFRANRLSQPQRRAGHYATAAGSSGVGSFSVLSGGLSSVMQLYTKLRSKFLAYFAFPQERPHNAAHRATFTDLADVSDEE